MASSSSAGYFPLSASNRPSSPTWFFYLIGSLKIGSAVALIAGLWAPSLVLVAAAIVSGLMLGALAMHMKAKDPGAKSIPALLMLLMSMSIFSVAIG